MNADSATDARTPGERDARVVRADLDRIKGPVDASTWVLVVSDFQCPYCAQWEKETAAQVDKEFVATGQVRLAFVHFPLQQHANSLPAAEASMCAGAQGQFWSMHDRIFATQEQWSAKSPVEPFFESLAQGVGMDVALYTQCMADDIMLPMIKADYERATASGAQSTPTFLIGNMTFPGAQKIEVFRMAIAQAKAGGVQ